MRDGRRTGSGRCEKIRQNGGGSKTPGQGVIWSSCSMNGVTWLADKGKPRATFLNCKARRFGRHIWESRIPRRGQALGLPSLPHLDIKEFLCLLAPPWSLRWSPQHLSRTTSPSPTPPCAPQGAPKLRAILLLFLPRGVFVFVHWGGLHVAHPAPGKTHVKKEQVSRSDSRDETARTAPTHPRSGIKVSLFQGSTLYLAFPSPFAISVKSAKSEAGKELIKRTILTRQGLFYPLTRFRFTGYNVRNYQASKKHCLLLFPGLI